MEKAELRVESNSLPALVKHFRARALRFIATRSEMT